jgi:4-amino-4-deoxy-L-arabinose transferase-like glycosyltransferase
MDVIHELRRYLTKPHVRPWALSAPILVLLFCIPLLRPLRNPDPSQISDDELARLATVQSLVEHRTLALDASSFSPSRGTVRVGDKLYADQPPTMAVLLAGPYWAMNRLGFTFGKDANGIAFFLTLIGVTIPVAVGAGMIYRMARLFELPRWKRGALALAVAFASGFVSYGVVLNSHAPAAALVLSAATCLVHIAVSRKPRITGGWLTICGLLAGLAAAIEPAAIIFTIFLAAVIPAMRWRWSLRVGGVVMYLIGLTPPLLLHVLLTVPVTGDLRPINWHPELHKRVDLRAQADLDDEEPGRLTATLDAASRVAGGIAGPHGLFSHFPILILGIVGIFAVMHRHWPMTTKVLAAGTGIAAAVILLGYCIASRAGPGSMFAARWFIVFAPLLAFWGGAWLRRQHHPLTWTLAGVTLLFSICVSVIGATGPFPKNGYTHYSATQALDNLITADALPKPTILAGG